MKRPKLVALHEAGHAILAACTGTRFDHARISEDDSRVSGVKHRSHVGHLQFFLAGAVAERLSRRRNDARDFGHDAAEIRKHSSRAEVERILPGVAERLSCRWGAVRAVQRALVEHRKLDAQDVLIVLGSTPTTTMRHRWTAADTAAIAEMIFPTRADGWTHVAEPKPTNVMRHSEPSSIRIDAKEPRTMKLPPNPYTKTGRRKHDAMTDEAAAMERARQRSASAWEAEHVVAGVHRARRADDDASFGPDYDRAKLGNPNVGSPDPNDEASRGYRGGNDARAANTPSRQSAGNGGSWEATQAPDDPAPDEPALRDEHPDPEAYDPTACSCSPTRLSADDAHDDVMCPYSPEPAAMRRADAATRAASYDFESGRLRDRMAMRGEVEHDDGKINMRNLADAEARNAARSAAAHETFYQRRRSEDE